MVPAVFVTLAHFLVVYLYPFIVQRTRLARLNEHTIQVRYLDGTGALRRIMLSCTELGFAIQGFTTRHGEEEMLHGVLGDKTSEEALAQAEETIVEVELELNGTTPINQLAHRLADIDAVRGLSVDDQPE